MVKKKEDFSSSSNKNRDIIFPDMETTAMKTSIELNSLLNTDGSDQESSEWTPCVATVRRVQVVCVHVKVVCISLKV